MKKILTIGDLAHGRSGDKGNDANIALIAYSKEGYDFLIRYLTEKKMMQIFTSLGVKEVIKYPVPNLLAVNFILKDVLGGGGSLSLRTDSQGKTLAQALLLQTIEEEIT